MPTHPIATVLAVLAAAVLCFALGTFRGSWRVWLVGYALTVAALALAYGGVRSARRASDGALRGVEPGAPTAAAEASQGAPASPGPRR